MVVNLGIGFNTASCSDATQISFEEMQDVCSNSIRRKCLPNAEFGGIPLIAPVL